MKNRVLAFLIVAVGFLASCDNEITDKSFITNVAPFTITNAPTLIMTNEADAEVITVSFDLSEEQIIETVVGVTIDEASTATEGMDFTLSTNEVDIDAFARTGSVDVTIIPDVLPDADPESIFLRLGGVASDVTPWSVSNEVVVEIQIFNDTTGAWMLNLITDWDQGRGIGVPSINGGDPSPVYGICLNSVDLDPYARNADNSFFTYSDDYGACPEQFSNLQNWPDDYYFFEVENFSNVFGNFPDAIGDLCIKSTFVRPGVSFLEVDQRPSTCYLATDLGYFDAGGSYEVRPLLNMEKSGGVFTVYDPVDDTELGTFTRTAGPVNAVHQQMMREKKANYTPVSPADVR